MINPDFAVASASLAREPAPAFPTPKKSSPRTAMFVEAIACSFPRADAHVASDGGRAIRRPPLIDTSSTGSGYVARGGGYTAGNAYVAERTCGTPAVAFLLAFTRRRCPIRSARSLARCGRDISCPARDRTWTSRETRRSGRRLALAPHRVEFRGSRESRLSLNSSTNLLHC